MIHKVPRENWTTELARLIKEAKPGDVIQVNTTVSGNWASWPWSVWA